MQHLLSTLLLYMRLTVLQGPWLRLAVFMATSKRRAVSFHKAFMYSKGETMLTSTFLHKRLPLQEVDDRASSKCSPCKKPQRSYEARCSQDKCCVSRVQPV